MRLLKRVSLCQESAARLQPRPRSLDQWSERTESAATPFRGNRLYELLEAAEDPNVEEKLRQAGQQERSRMILWSRAFQHEIGESEDGTELRVDRGLAAGQLWLWDRSGEPLEQINWESAFYFNPKGKTRKARRLVPLSERVIALLRNIQLEQSGQTEGWVFPSKKSTSGHIGLSGIEHAFRKLARKLGIPDALKLYCARHTFGTVAMAETRNPGLVKEVMGHESLDTTMGYLHPETSQIKVVIDRLNQQKYMM